MITSTKITVSLPIKFKCKDFGRAWASAPFDPVFPEDAWVLINADLGPPVLQIDLTFIFFIFIINILEYDFDVGEQMAGVFASASCLTSGKEMSFSTGVR